MSIFSGDEFYDDDVTSGPDPASNDPMDMWAVMMAGEDDDDANMKVRCQWYALCTNESVGHVAHPVLGDVPICQRCADLHDLDVTPGHGRGRRR